ncbi:MAG: aminotransferase class V-fold PLP-dependent enzyme [Candidatus Bathyarchaeia archaeon]
MEEVRQQIPLLAGNVYLDNAGAGPPPMSVHAAMRSFLDEWRDYGEKWEAWLLEIVKTRELFGRLINATLDEVACIPNVSSGLAAIADALPLKPGQNIVVSELNFPTNVYLWHALKQKGLLSEVRVLKAKNGQVPTSDFEKAIDDKTVAVSLDHVSWINGCREDIRAITQIAHSHGALMLVDVFHSAGVIPVDVRKMDVDILTCGTYKWLMGPHGTAFLYVSRQTLKQLDRGVVGWHGISDSVVARVRSKQGIFERPFDISSVTPAEDATRFELGTWAVIAVMGAKAALEFTLKYTPQEREPLVEHLNNRLVEGLEKKKKKITSPLEAGRRSGIVTFEVEDATQLSRKLLQEHIVVAPRANTLRVSPHFYNTDHEIDTFLEKL